MKSSSISNFVCLCFVIFCMIYAKVYSEILYYHPYPDFFTILYRYFTYQILCFSIMKILGSMLKKKRLLKIGVIKSNSYLVIGFFILYFGFIFLMETGVFSVTVLYTSARYFIYALFGFVGLLVGFSDTI